MPIVDAHPHIYSPDRDAYPTIDDPWEPGEPASAEDLKKKMDVVGVDRAVFIQTSTFYGFDNRYVMDSAKEHADWACGVVTLDPDDRSHIDLLEDAVANSNIRGMRGIADSMNRISSPNVYRLWTKAMELGIPVNCMVMDDLDRVPEIERIAQDLGELKIVIDHCFMLNTRHRTEATLEALELLALQPNIYAKLTPGTHGSYRVYPFVDMHDPLKRVIEAFGPSRCVWGSNFPNALWSKGATYSQNLHLFVKELGLNLPDKADILGVTAMSLWFPKEHEKAERIATEQQERTEQEVIDAQDDGSSLEEDDEGVAEQDERSARVTDMAELIKAQREAPVLDAAESAELAAILEVANDLNAVLGVTEEEVEAAAPEAVAAAEPGEEDKQKSPTAKKTKPQPKIRRWDGDPSAGTETQRKPAIEPVDIEPGLALPAAKQTGAPDHEVDEPDDIEDEPTVNVGRFHQAQDVAGVDEAETAETGSPGETAVDVEQLMAALDDTPDNTGEAGGQKQSEEPATVLDSEVADGESDMSGILDLAQKLNDMLESAEEIGSHIAEITAEDEAS